MQYYVDIRILPDPEFKPSILMSALYNKLHRVLVYHKSKQLGLSFPEMDQEKPTLGSIMRLHGSQSDLEQLMAQNWLIGMRDHISLKTILSVPQSTLYRVVSRKQSKSNVERLRRRLIKRKGMDEHLAKEMITDNNVRLLSLPFVIIKSASTGQNFRLFIEHRDIQNAFKEGSFSKYGLSQDATIPWF